MPWSIRIIVLLMLCAAGVPRNAVLQADEAGVTMNVLFIAVDDLRPELNCYGKTHIHSPNLDGLARRGMVFQRAYCQAAVCRASRASVLTGLRPDSTEVWTNGSRHRTFRSHLPDIVTLPQQFKKHGYHSQSIGKIYHGAFAVRNRWNDPPSWSEPPWFATPRYYFTDDGVRVARDVFAKSTGAKGDKVDDWVNHFVLGLSHEAPDVDDDLLQDGQTAVRAIAALRENRDRPFFMAVGFYKPHLPFIAPKKYWDMYPSDQVQVATNLQPPIHATAYTGTSWGHPRTYTDFPNRGEPSPELTRELTRGYAACVSYLDAQVGRVLDELDRLELSDKTIVVFWGDHGWHIGENHIWGKATNFELSTRAPLIVCDPRMKAAGKKTSALVEFVDIYPTLCDLAGLPLPEHLEGVSFARLLDDPQIPWKSAAFSQYPNKGYMGRSLRTDRYRLTEWSKVGNPKQIGAVELYDHQNDPQENANIAGASENEALVKRLTTQLNAGWRAALPPDSTK